MPVSIRGTAGGSVTLSSGAAAADTTLTLPNTTGTVALTASPTFSGTVTATTVTSPASTALTIQSAGTTAMTVDTSQNVGIGTTSPSARLQVSSAASPEIAVRSTASASWKSRISFGNTTASKWEIGVDIGDVGNNNLYFYDVPNNTERMRLDSSGNLLVGTTSAGGTADPLLSLKKSGGTTWQAGPAGAGSGNLFYVLNSSDVGVYLSSGNTSWTANSDERLKTDLVPITDGAEKVSSLRAVTGRFKTDKEGTSRSFLIAQDVQKVLPEAVDASNPDKLGVQYTDVIPLLVAAIKELSAKNDALEARLAALEAK